MKYFILWAGALYPAEHTRLLEGGEWGGLEAGAFMDGTTIKLPVKTPIEIELIDDETGKEQMPPLFVVPALVVRKDFAAALSEAGVTSVDYYPAILRDVRRGQQYDDYLVGNVVGLIDAIDMQSSEVDEDSPLGMPLFDTMVIDEAKCRGALLFRLMGRQNLIVIAESVADVLRQKDFQYLHIVEPEEFA